MNDFDELLDGVLAREFNTEPHPGMSQRVLANALLQDRRIRLRRRSWIGLAASVVIGMTSWTLHVALNRKRISPIVKNPSSMVRGAQTEPTVAEIGTDDLRSPPSDQTASIQMPRTPRTLPGVATLPHHRTTAPDRVRVAALVVDPVVIEPLEIQPLSSNVSTSQRRVKAK